MSNDPLNPNHYKTQSKVQVIEVIRYLPFSIGNAIKYVYRNENKENPKQDLNKALWYLNDFMTHPVICRDMSSSYSRMEDVFPEGCEENLKLICAKILHAADLDSYASGESLEENIQECKKLIQQRIDALS